MGLVKYNALPDDNGDLKKPKKRAVVQSHKAEKNFYDITKRVRTTFCN